MEIDFFMKVISNCFLVLGVLCAIAAMVMCIIEDAVTFFIAIFGCAAFFGIIALFTYFTM